MPKPGAMRIAAVLALPLCLLGLSLFDTVHGSQLVDPVPTGLWLGFVAIGLVPVLGMIFLIATRASAIGAKAYLAMTLIALVTILALSYASRLAYEAIGFTAVTPGEAALTGPIIDMSQGKNLNDIATVKLGPDTRELRVYISRDLYNRLDAHRHPGRDCMTLTVQTGRYGIRRAMLPATFVDPITADRVTPCPGYFSID